MRFLHDDEIIDASYTDGFSPAGLSNIEIVAEIAKGRVVEFENRPAALLNQVL